MIFTSEDTRYTTKYLYNDFGEPVGMVFYDGESSETYLFTKNMQGDITRIVSANGNLQVSYTYDAHGKRTVTYNSNTSNTIGIILRVSQMVISALTPFGYRGYCYDAHTGLYYLQSRYYDPNTGRFINADSTNYLNSTSTVLGCNLFIYCENDPVNNVDPTGCFGVNNIKNLISSIISFLSNKLKNILKDKLGIRKSGNCWYISTSTMATVVDAVFLVGNAIKAAVKSTAIKSACGVIRNYAKNNPTKFANKYLNKLFDYVAKYLPNFFNVTFKSFLKSFGIKLGIKLTASLVSSRLQKVSDVYKWISILTSPGHIIATIMDIVTDGKWNKQIRV